MLEAIGVAGCAYSHLSARIGEAADGLASGVVSHVNAPARAMGIQAGDRVAAIVAARCGQQGARARAPSEPA
jgi:nucleotidyltransferase/DNA polymerase involved in DNA repair